MNNLGHTPWMTEIEWWEYSRMTRSLFNRVIRDLLDDSEIQREINREETPHRWRWINKNPEKKGVPS